MRKTIVPLLLVLFASGCGSLGRLDARPGAGPDDLAGYDRVIVADFAANDARTARDDAQAAARAAAMEAGRQVFAERIAEEIRASGAFAEVARGKLPAPALQLTGTVDRWEPGNVAARSLLGFVGKSEFSATVIVSDLGSGRELGRIVVDRNSWPLPIAASTNLVQSVDFLMGQAARRIADELAKAKGLPARQP